MIYYRCIYISILGESNPPGKLSTETRDVLLWLLKSNNNRIFVNTQIFSCCRHRWELFFRSFIGTSLILHYFLCFILCCTFPCYFLNLNLNYMNPSFYISCSNAKKKHFICWRLFCWSKFYLCVVLTGFRAFRGSNCRTHRLPRSWWIINITLKMMPFWIKIKLYIKDLSEIIPTNIHVFIGLYSWMKSENRMNFSKTRTQG